MSHSNPYARRPMGNTMIASTTAMTRVKVPSQPYWLARPWQTPASFLPARGRTESRDQSDAVEPVTPGTVTGLPQGEQKRAPPGSETPQAEQYEAIRHHSRPF